MSSIEVDEHHAGQRVDNFLMTVLKGVPKSRIYRAIRGGEVRVNKGRVKAQYRLQEGDWVRIPPIKTAVSERLSPPIGLLSILEKSIIYESDYFLLLNKPAGIPVHGGSGLQGGVIDIFRMRAPTPTFLELVHRLDKGTSGCLLIAKKRSFLVMLNELIHKKKVQKRYLALIAGQWPHHQTITVNEPLRKNALRSGERIVCVDVTGREAQTQFCLIQQGKNHALLECIPKTGRTHQIRVHLAHLGFPIVGDDKYGGNKAKRLYLHSASLSWAMMPDDSNRYYAFCAVVDTEFFALTANHV